MRFPRWLATLGLSALTSCALCGTVRASSEGPVGAAPAAASVAAQPDQDEDVYSVRFDATVSEASAQRLATILHEAQKANAKSIVLVINSPGGSVSAGEKMTRDMDDSPIPVFCIVDGEADSMAFYILQSCKLRIMLKRSRLMAHEPSNGAGVSGNRFEFQSYVDYYRTLALAMAEHESQRLRISKEEFLKRTENREWWMGWEEALTVGAVDEVYVTVADAIAAVQQRVNPTPPLP